MNKIMAIAGGILVVLASIFGFFFNVDSAVVIEIAVAFFGATLIVVSTIKQSKEAGSLTWKTYVAVIASALGGCLCAIGGLEKSAITAIVGAVIALLSVFASIYGSKIKISVDK